MIDENLFPSDGSPRDLQMGGTTRIWDKIDSIEKKCNKTAEDVAYIRGLLENQGQKEERRFNMKSGIVAAIVSSGVSLLAVLFGVRN